MDNSVKGITEVHISKSHCSPRLSNQTSQIWLPPAESIFLHFDCWFSCLLYAWKWFPGLFVPSPSQRSGGSQQACSSSFLPFLKVEWRLLSNSLKALFPFIMINQRLLSVASPWHLLGFLAVTRASHQDLGIMNAQRFKAIKYNTDNFYAESKNCRSCKGLRIIKSNSFAKAGSLGKHPGGLWISPEKETPPSHWAACSCVPVHFVPPPFFFSFSVNRFWFVCLIDWLIVLFFFSVNIFAYLATAIFWRKYSCLHTDS